VTRDRSLPLARWPFAESTEPRWYAFRPRARVAGRHASENESGRPARSEAAWNTGCCSQTGHRSKARVSVVLLQICTAYPQADRNGSATKSERGARPKHRVRDLGLRNSEMSETPRFRAVSVFDAPWCRVWPAGSRVRAGAYINDRGMVFETPRGPKPDDT